MRARGEGGGGGDSILSRAGAVEKRDKESVSLGFDESCMSGKNLMHKKGGHESIRLEVIVPRRQTS